MTSGTADVTAVIVHYRSPEETARAVRAVNTTAPGADVVVVDNASGDGIRARLEREGLRARVVEEPANRGYGAGCNRGARESSGALLLFLNSDAALAATGPAARERRRRYRAALGRPSRPRGV